MRTRWAVTIVCAMLVGLGASSGAAGEWPGRTVEIICGGSAGGDTDFNARAFVEPLTKALGQAVVIVNMPGGGTSVATDFVHDAKPDGYTVLINHNAVYCLQAAGSIGYGADEFEMVGIVAQSPGDVLLVNSASGFKTLEDFIAAAKAKPGTLSLSLNAGANTYVEGVAFASKAGVEFNIVDGGTGAEKCAALLGGHVDSTILAYGTAKPYLESGDFVALAIFMPERSRNIPDVPTLKEKGIDVSFPMRYMFMMPKGAPADAAARLYAEIEKVVKNDANYAKTIKTGYGQEPFCLNAKDAQNFFNNDIVPLVREYINLK